MHSRRRYAFVALFTCAIGGTRAASAEVKEISWADLSKTVIRRETVCTVPKITIPVGCLKGHYDPELNMWLYEWGECPAQVCPIPEERREWTERVPLPNGHLIDVSIENNAAPFDTVEFRFDARYMARITVGSDVTSDRWRVWKNQTGQLFCNWPQAATPNCDAISEWSSVALSGGGFLGFADVLVVPPANHAGQIIYLYRDVYVLRHLEEQLKPGDRVTFKWVK